MLHLSSGNLFGGIEVCERAVAQYRHVSDWELEFGFCFDGKIAAELRELDVPVHHLGEVRYSRPWTIAAARRRLRQLLAARVYDCVICDELWVHGIFAPTIRARNMPLGLWLHDKHGRRGLLERLAVMTPPDFVVCNGRYSGDAVPTFLPRVPFRIVHCPVAPPTANNLQPRSSVRRSFQTADDAVVVLQVGRWEPHKGHRFHLEALAQLRDVPDWVCWQVGQPQRPEERAYFAEIQELGERLGIADRVRYLGWQPDLERVFQSADIFCQPNISPEPFGLVFIEAMYHGLPVVATPLGGPCEIITADTGVLVSEQDSRELAGCLRELITSSERRQHLSRGGPARARLLCDPAQQVQRLTTFLAEQMSRLGRVGSSR